MSEQTARSSTSSQPAPSEQPIWWEKTVEYKFVLHFLPEAAAVAPLGGRLVEPAEGDLRLMLDGKFALIEFKKDVQSIGDEARKYTNGPARHPVGAGASLAGLPALTAMRTAAANAASSESTQGPAETLSSVLSVLDEMAAAPGHHLIHGILENGRLALRSRQYSQLDGRRTKQPHVAMSAAQSSNAEQTSTTSVIPNTTLVCVPGDEMVEYLKVLAELRGRPDIVGSDGFVVAVSKDGKGQQVYPLSIVLQAALPRSAAARDVPASRPNTPSKRIRP